MQHSNRGSCILLKFYIKPQLRLERELAYCVVSYWNSTSNHNLWQVRGLPASVVSYWNSTSNHNSGVGVNATMSLYLIEILHQTTTRILFIRIGCRLYLIEILHQTTTSPWTWARLLCCILSKFYIKPQLVESAKPVFVVVSYRNSTSNHNWFWCCFRLGPLYLIEILHQTTTVFRLLDQFWSCILSKFYIKPQLEVVFIQRRLVVSYRNSTSNHNQGRNSQNIGRLYLIEILHQTTTPWRARRILTGCILSKFYIKPQRHGRVFFPADRCILSKFYIKPQRAFRLRVLL